MEPETHVHPGVEKLTAGSHSSVWIDSTEPLAFRKLEDSTETDVVIVGGGIAGITIAYCLVRSGKKVIVLDDGFVGSGETGRTTAHLVTALDNRYYQLEGTLGKEKAKLAAESHREAIDFIERAVRRHNIDCDFKRVDGYLFFHPTDDVESFNKEFNAASRAGLDVERLEMVPGLKEYYGPCLHFYNQAQMHPLKYVKALCEVIQNNGGTIYTNVHVKDVDADGIVTDNDLRIYARHIVVATNTPVNNRFAIHLKQTPYRTYVIGAKIKKGSMPESLWWDSGDFSVNKEVPPYHYVRTQPLDATHDLLIIGGEDHRVGDTSVEHIPEEKRYAKLEEWARHYFTFDEVIYKWSGQVMEPDDGMAYIGKNPWDNSNIYIVTGDSGNGMTHAAIAGVLIDDLINGRKNKFEALYHPSRMKLSKTSKNLFGEIAGSLKKYFSGKDKSKESDYEKIDALNINEGIVAKLDGKEFGVFCDEDNRLHFVEAACTHLKCTVKFNNDEKSWDCPCHGSRFTYEGKVINGPANKDLPYHSEIRPANVKPVYNKTIKRDKE